MSVAVVVFGGCAVLTHEAISVRCQQIILKIIFENCKYIYRERERNQKENWCSFFLKHPATVVSQSVCLTL